MIKNTVAYSEAKDKFQDFDAVSEKIDKEGYPTLVIFFSSSDSFDFFSLKFHKHYENSTVIGSSNSFMYTQFGYSEDALAAVAFYDGIEFSADVLLEVTHYPKHYAERVEEALKNFKDTQNTICLEFCTSCGNCEELVQDTFRSVLENRDIPVVGGTAGANSFTGTTEVSLNGTVYSEGCVFVFIKNMTGRIFIYKENIYRPLNRYITSTDVDCDERIVYEYDGRPAADVFAEFVNVPLRELKDKIGLYPIGRVRGDDIYITCPDRIMPDGSITYFARIYNRTKMALLEKANLEEVWENTAKVVKSEIPNPSLVIGINCDKRAELFKRENRNADFCNEMEKNYGNFVCMSGFGEQVKFEHFNLTFVLCVFE